MSQQIITCINCPVGCRMTVTVEDGQVIEVKDNQCKRGDVYARQESVRPLRMVTAVAPVKGSAVPVSLKTASPIPKDKIRACMQAVRTLDLTMPIILGQVLLEDAAGTGVALIATRNLP